MQIFTKQRTPIRGTPMELHQLHYSAPPYANERIHTETNVNYRKSERANKLPALVRNLLKKLKRETRS